MCTFPTKSDPKGAPVDMAFAEHTPMCTVGEQIQGLT